MIKILTRTVIENSSLRCDGYTLENKPHVFLKCFIHSVLQYRDRNEFTIKMVVSSFPCVFSNEHSLEYLIGHLISHLPDQQNLSPYCQDLVFILVLKIQNLEIFILSFYYTVFIHITNSELLTKTYFNILTNYVTFIFFLCYFHYYNNIFIYFLERTEGTK